MSLSPVLVTPLSTHTTPSSLPFQMEDAHVTVDQYAGHPRQGYFAVYDGHGGRGVVEFIERQLHLNLETELDEAKQSRRSVEECM